MNIDEIDKLIASSLKEGRADELRVYRLIKSEMLLLLKNNVELTNLNVAKMLLKMATQRKDSIREYIDGGRNDLAKDEQAELDIISKYLPAEPTEQEIADYTRACAGAYKVSKEEGYKLSMRDIKPIMTLVQEKYPSVSGKIISSTLKEILC